MKGMDLETRARLLEQAKEILSGKLNPPIKLTPDAVLLDAMPRMLLRAGRAQWRLKPAS